MNEFVPGKVTSESESIRRGTGVGGKGLGHFRGNIWKYQEKMVDVV